MLLYENNGKKIDVYDFTPDECALTKYRKKEIKKLNPDDLFYCFETTNEKLMQRFEGAEKIDVGLVNREEETKKDWWSEIEPEKPVIRSEKLIQKAILEEYINGAFSGVLPTQIFVPPALLGCHDTYLYSYLVTEDYKCLNIRLEENPVYRIRNLIKLPNNLCALQLLLNGEFLRIFESSLDYIELLQYFKAVKETEISTDELKGIIHMELVSETYNEIQAKINTTAKILKNVKKIG